ncbi:MAG: hypothetical protein DJ555_02345 [Desulfurococcaceae archaeon]|jgi:Fe-S oxidoreductase|nr:MAG: hypothetical protein DJ555_02345 [Desulfurococcaceae archaeon]
MNNAVWIASISIYLILLIASILGITHRLKEYGGLRKIFSYISMADSNTWNRFLVEVVLQGRFFRWGGEPAIEGVFRGVALYSYMLIMVLSLLYAILLLLEGGSILRSINTLIAVIGAVALVSGVVILVNMRPREGKRSWLIELGGRDLAYLAVIPILGGVALSSLYYREAIALALAISPIIILLTPHTRFWYNIASALNVFINKQRNPGKLPTPFKLSELSEETIDKIKVGVGFLTDIEPERLVNLDSCANCGLCDSVCPAYAVGRPLSPRKVVLVTRQGVRMDPGKQVVDLLQDDTFWACTTCGACVEICPMGVDHVPLIVDVRRWLVFNSKMDQKKISLISSIAQSGNSMGAPNYGRHDWIRKLGVQLAEETGDYDYLLWVGCMGSFDDRARKAIQAFIEVLKEAGIRVAVLGDLEMCCGDPLRRLGEESRFQDIALRNIDLFKRLGVKRIVTICPHGFNTFKNEYKELDPTFDVEILHHSQLLSKLVEEGRIKPKSKISGTATMHDSCYIARINRIEEEPRRIIRISSETYKEARRSGYRTFCCGAGGSNYWYDVPEKKRISVERVEELASLGVNTIVAECPFCIAMLEDALRNLGLDKDIKVRDLSEILREAGA